MVWSGGLMKSGYSQLGVRRDGKTKTLYGHRVMYESFVGPIPEGLHLDHLCRNRACVRPDHLEPVTNRENVHRGLAGPKSRVKRGHALTSANRMKRPDGRPGDSLTCHRNRERRRAKGSRKEKGAVASRPEQGQGC